MPSSIPYDHPSLTLGSVVDTKLINIFKQISDQQTKVDAAQEKVNSYIMMKRSLAMTINELINMNVEVTNLKNEIKTLEGKIKTAANEYMKTRITSETQIQQLRSNIGSLDLDNTTKSPLDFSSSKIISLSLSAGSLKLDSQYFSYASNTQDDTVANIEKYINESTSGNVGNKSADLAKAVTTQISQQRQNHSLAGTLIITASCTHPKVAMIEPFIIDVDKAIEVWNSTYKGDQIKTADLFSNPSIIETLSKANADGGNEQCLTVISGATYGSSFVGMVHILKSNNTSLGLTDKEIANLQNSLSIGGWLQNADGGFGVGSNTMSDIKKMLSAQNISSHISVIVMGAIPTIASSQLKLSVQSFIKPKPEEMNTYLSIFEQTSSNNTTVGSAATEAKTDGRLVNVQKATMQTIIRELGQIDHGSNNVFDINSLMTAFTNYISSINKDQIVGMPISFHVRKITKSQILRLWADKYFPKGKTVEENSQSKNNVQAK